MSAPQMTTAAILGSFRTELIAQGFIDSAERMAMTNLGASALVVRNDTSKCTCECSS